jgi:hypothetical protein
VLPAFLLPAVLTTTTSAAPSTSAYDGNAPASSPAASASTAAANDGNATAAAASTPAATATRLPADSLCVHPGHPGLLHPHGGHTLFCPYNLYYILVYNFLYFFNIFGF